MFDGCYLHCCCVYYLSSFAVSMVSCLQRAPLITRGSKESDMFSLTQTPKMEYLNINYENNFIFFSLNGYK